MDIGKLVAIVLGFSPIIIIVLVSIIILVGVHFSPENQFCLSKGFEGFEEETKDPFIPTITCYKTTDFCNENDCVERRIYRDFILEER